MSLDRVHVDGLTRLIGPVLDGRPRVGIVGLPFHHPDPLTHHTSQAVAAAPEIGTLGDVGDRADVAAGIPAADLAPRSDEHHAERGIICGQAVRNHCGITRFENPQRQLLAGQHRHLAAGTSA